MKSEHSNWLSGDGRRSWATFLNGNDNDNCSHLRMIMILIQKSRHSNSVKLRNDQWSVAGTPVWNGEIRHLQFLKFPLRFQTNKKGIPIKEIPFSLYITPMKIFQILMELFQIPMNIFQISMELFQIQMEIFSPHNIVTKHLNNASS